MLVVLRRFLEYTSQPLLPFGVIPGGGTGSHFPVLGTYSVPQTILWFGFSGGTLEGEGFFLSPFLVVVAYVLGFAHSRDCPFKHQT